MSKRVYELAKELKISSGDLLSVIQDVGLENKSQLSGLDDKEVEIIKDKMRDMGKLPSNKGKEAKSTNPEHSQKIVVTINKNKDGDIHAKKVAIEEVGKEGKTEKIIEESNKGDEDKKKKIVIKKSDDKTDKKDMAKVEETKAEGDNKEKTQAESKPKVENKGKEDSKAQKKSEPKTANKTDIKSDTKSAIKSDTKFETKPEQKEKSKAEDKQSVHNNKDKSGETKKELQSENTQNKSFEKKSSDNKRTFNKKGNDNKKDNDKKTDKNKRDNGQSNKKQGNQNRSGKDTNFKKDDKNKNFRKNNRNFKKDDDDSYNNSYKGNKKHSSGRKNKDEEFEDLIPEKSRRDYSRKNKKKDNYRRVEIENESFEKRNPRKKQKPNTPPKKDEKDEIKIIEIEDEITVKEFSEKIGVSPSKVIQKLIILGIMASQNETIDIDVAQLVGEEFNVIVEQKKEEIPEEINIEEEFELDFEDKEEDLKPRWPIVTVMGHVDHGKTSLLDAIKSTNVTGGEAGGITQKIGAYMVNVGNKKICFIDTPGHEAFTAMRARGAQVTDIAILVVAADDGVMPQTIEAINHAKAAGVPIVVAINKIDKPEANIEKIKQELVEQGLVPEEWGGDTIMVPVSAKKNLGIEELLEMVLLVAEMQNLRANPDRTMVGNIIEAELDKHQGAKATVIISKGTLNVGDNVVSGTAYGRVRSILDDKGKRIKKAGPSTPVVIFGLSEVPNAGDVIYSTSNEKQAKSAAQLANDIEKEELKKSNKKVSLDDLFEQIKLGEIKDLNLIIKADGRGSIEALKASLMKMKTDEVKPNIIHEGVGGITESDVMLASASNAIIIGFNVRPNVSALDNAKHEEVDIRTYKVIYDAIEDIKDAIIGMHAPKFVEEVIGHATVRNVFGLPNGQKIAGIYVNSGKVLRKAKVRLIRDDVVIIEKAISSLKRFKDDAKEVQSGFEAGLGIENYNDIKIGDEIEVFIDKEMEIKDLDI